MALSPEAQLTVSAPWTENMHANVCAHVCISGASDAMWVYRPGASSSQPVLGNVIAINSCCHLFRKRGVQQESSISLAAIADFHSEQICVPGSALRGVWDL